MKFARYRVEEQVRYGIVEVDNVTDLDGTPFGEYQVTDRVHPLADVKLLVPSQPRNLLATGLQTRSHAEAEQNRPLNTGGWNVRSEPHITVRIAGSIIGPEDPIIRPKDAESLREEVELVAVIGKKCKRVPREKIAEYILGYTVGNDLTIKGFEYDDEGWKAKGCDTMHPIGPWVETDIDPDKILLRARVDGVEVQAEPMSTHLFDVASIIATINKYVTLYPGDMVFLGTSGDPVDCVPGDVVEVEAEGIGVLRNPVVAEN